MVDVSRGVVVAQQVHLVNNLRVLGGSEVFQLMVANVHVGIERGSVWTPDRWETSRALWMLASRVFEESVQVLPFSVVVQVSGRLAHALRDREQVLLLVRLELLAENPLGGLQEGPHHQAIRIIRECSVGEG